MQLTLAILLSLLFSPLSHAGDEGLSNYNYHDNITLTCPDSVYNSKNKNNNNSDVGYHEEMQWFKGGQNVLTIKQKRRMHVEGRLLKIRDARFEDIGDYKCVAASSSHTVHVSVTGKPVWKKSNSFFWPPSLSKVAGADVKLQCHVTAIPPATSITWYKNGEIIKRKGYELSLHSVTERDRGEYRCLVMNDLGTVQRSVMLDVTERLNTRPIFNERLDNRTIPEHSNTTLSCSVYSDLPYQLYWVFKSSNNTSLQETTTVDTNVSITPLDDELKKDDEIDSRGYADLKVLVDRLGVVVATRGGEDDNDDLALNEVDASGEGMYSCVVSNDNGFVHQSMWLSVGLPSNTSKAFNKNLLLAVCVLIVLLLLLLFLLICRYCRSKKIQLKVQREGQMRRRVVVIRENTLYTHDLTSQTSLLATPRVKLEKHLMMYDDDDGCDNRPDYQIPLDTTWEVDRERLSVEDVLGEGAFGKVAKATLRTGAQTKLVAVKMLKEDASDQDLMDLVQEMEVMKTIGQHPNVLSLIGCSTQNGPLYVIIEYAMHGNLRDYLKEMRPGNSTDTRLSFSDLVSFAIEISCGLDYLASKMCVHRDVAARNVMVAEGHRMKIGDFGLTRSIGKKDYYKKTTDGRLPVKWMSPEALFDRKCSVQSDVWSYGVLLWELFSLGGSPYPSVPVEHLFRLLKAGYRMEAPVYCTAEIYDLMLRCWSLKPSLRPSFSFLHHTLQAILYRLHHSVSNEDPKEALVSGNYNYNSIKKDEIVADENGNNYLCANYKTHPKNTYINNDNNNKNNYNNNHNDKNKNNYNNSHNVDHCLESDSLKVKSSGGNDEITTKTECLGT